MKENLIFLFLVIILISCARVPMGSLTPAEESYLTEVEKCPTVLKFSSGESGDAWGRAITWICNYSSMKIESVSDYTIVTYIPVTIFL